jgi:hypothetical protein
VVLTKSPEDCFICFNRLGPKRNYSTYQYPAEERYEDNFTRIIREASLKENRETGNSFGNGRMSTTEINDIKREFD